jgi:serine/threonine protein kinase
VKQFASGVAYVHSMGKVHGNIVPVGPSSLPPTTQWELNSSSRSSPQWNVMITEDGRVCLSDVGLNVRLIIVLCGDRRRCPSGWIFKAPEELSFDCDPASFMPTAQMDVYAFATTVYTVSIYTFALFRILTPFTGRY